MQCIYQKYVLVCRLNNIYLMMEAILKSIYCQACQPAAMLALDDVNNNENLLKGYRLNLVWNDSLVSIYKQLNNKFPISILL